MKRNLPLSDSDRGRFSLPVCSFDQLSSTDFLLHAALHIFSDVRFRTLHSGCAASLAPAVALAVAFIAVDAVYFVLLPPTHACALGPSALHRLQRQFTHPVQSHTHHVSHYVQAYYVRDITSTGITAVRRAGAAAAVSPTSLRSPSLSTSTSPSPSL